jgi:hypothetical protein
MGHRYIGRSYFGIAESDARGHDKVPADGHEEVPTLDLIHEPGTEAP